MKRPMSTFQMQAYALFFVGPFFILFGALYQAGILESTLFGAPATVFMLQGAIITAIAVIFYFYPPYRMKQKSKLQESGVAVTAEVIEVRQIKSTRINGQNPYRIHFVYKKHGRHYGKTALIWSPPRKVEGGTFPVYINPEKPKEYYAPPEAYM